MKSLALGQKVKPNQRFWSILSFTKAFFRYPVFLSQIPEKAKLLLVTHKESSQPLGTSLHAKALKACSQQRAVDLDVEVGLPVDAVCLTKNKDSSEFL